MSRNQDIRNSEKNRQIIFARHETFHPRFGWLKKGFDHASIDSRIFLKDDAPIRLGVGKNMVRSIRYWCSAFKLLEDDQPTVFGQKLLGQQGWDPYLEDVASLWLLHWKLLESSCLATAWDIAFNHFHKNEFTSDDIFHALCECRDREAPRISESSLKKDASCLLRMYVAQSRSKAQVNEDSLDCPFAELGLINSAGDSRHYVFQFGLKNNLPPEVVAYACLCHYAQTGNSAKTIPLASLLYDVGSPGLVFKLTESAVCDSIERVSRHHSQIQLSDAAGKMQLSLDDDPLILAESILNHYYHAGR